MSVWTEVSGIVHIPSRANFSLDKSIKWMFESSRPKIEQYLPEEFRILFSFIGDGVTAATQVQRWIGELPKGSKVDIEVNIRFLK